MASAKRGRGRSRRPRSAWWQKLPFDELLDVRIRDLELRIEGTALEARVAQLWHEIERKGLRFRPHVWLSTDWFTPDGVTGFAIPFYLAHPRLVRIEHRFMFEAEGAAHDECMRILRHEAGHAIDTAFRLRWRKRWRDIFGRASEPYRETYTPRPSSKDYVHNLDFWYAQSHPTEDFAETFAVWLQPGSSWRKRYAGWPALAKLSGIDAMFTDLVGERPVTTNRSTPDSLPRLRMTLREYYQEKRGQYGTEPSAVYDRYLRVMFSAEPRYDRRMSAAEFLRRSRHELRSRVGAMTGQYRYVVDQILKFLIVRCRELGLRQMRNDAETRIDAAVLLTLLTSRAVQIGRRQYLR